MASNRNVFDCISTEYFLWQITHLYSDRPSWANLLMRSHLSKLCATCYNSPKKNMFSSSELSQANRPQWLALRLKILTLRSFKYILSPSQLSAMHKNSGQIEYEI